ncbi:MAG TPA: methionine adenosyltransferase [Nanoarchaeota archaeon]|nr:methionine adenosyltransferase [Candidatus Pacearchaeota archaeon]HIH18029.1 methionine adenosyltransferase [Nanoarchaeota archaeon]HIH34630.1 methionine adenosyltransferase [Nanoarchaeota archaeon]HIH51375.1 methionine adenosyltransferase [Nanoarchaeota archaeon]HIH66230.1 methionine adenosyltransferase [Nanoarchaeota archaeon]
MRKGNFFFTSESVTEGHPDKICDQISDYVLDKILAQDKHARVACETMCGAGFILVTGEITTSTYVDVKDVVRRVLKDVGYTKPEYGFDYKSVGVLTSINTQSPDIALGVNAKGAGEQGTEGETGAGDQGMMSGYATSETPELMPLPILLAHKITKKLAEVRKSGELPYLRPDGKSQVTIEYKDGLPLRADAIVVAAQHDEYDIEKLRKDIKEKVVLPVCGKWLDTRTKFFINNTGRFIIGGPVADSGCTGRKIIADSYGGVGNHGGGAFSGKDPTKVDRTAAYMARYIAKNIVAAGLAEKCEVQLAYVIGGREPISLMIDTFSTEKGLENGQLLELVKKHFALSPSGMIKQLDLLRPIYKKTSCYGHFGREEPEFTWERTDKAKLLRREAGLR